MGRVALRLVALVASVLGAAAVILVAIATRRLDRRYDVPTPAIVRATAPDALARGQRLYRSACASCHTPPGQTRSCGAPVRNFPAAFGSIQASNLTSDPQYGIGGRSDADLARLLRHGVLPDGRYSRTMPRLARLGDEDIAALMGFLRSDDPLFAPCNPGAAAATAPGHLSLTGKVALAFLSPAPPANLGPSAPASIPVPARGPTPAYGRYLATAIYGCVECHTDGLTDLDTKLAAPNLLSGGMELPDPRGTPIESTNLTPDATGLGAWTLADFQRALSTGIGRAGLVVRSPMPIFRYSEPVEIEAIFAYLQSVRPVKHQPRVFQARQRPTPTTPPEEVFIMLGCGACHGTGAPFRPQLLQAARRPAPAVARSLRYPEESNPGTQMPSYASVLDDAQARSLAAWLTEVADKSRPGGSMFP
jgi:mono/diheme cytochrome c family protein